MTGLPQPDSLPGFATSADIDILSHELYVASRRVFGDVFPRVAGQYQKTLDLVGDREPEPEDPVEFELTVDTVPKPKGAMQVVRYGLAIVSFALSEFEGYKTAISREHQVDPLLLTAQSKVKTYLYSTEEEGRAVIEPTDECPLEFFPNNERPRRRPRYDAQVKLDQDQLPKNELELIYDCLSNSGCYDRRMADIEAEDE